MASTQIQSLIKESLKNENLKDIKVNLVGNSELGDGYLGDIVFTEVKATTPEGLPKNYDLVLKCSKKSQALRDTQPVKEIFMNEITMYKKILPMMVHFQKEKLVDDIFDNVPKYYGSITTDNAEIILLENLKALGYSLYPKKNPLTREHIEMVVAQYGKFHATSAALEIQKPHDFANMINSLQDVMARFMDNNDMETMFTLAIDELVELLKDEVEDNILNRWKCLKEQITYIVMKMTHEDDFKVITHGDCWNNNFMYKYKDKNPSRAVFLDWQISRYDTPITDLSYFLLCCLSEKDLKQIDDILKIYHDSFCNHLKRLGVENAYSIYSFEQFQIDWKRFARYGILMASLIMKIVSTEKDEVVGIDQLADVGKAISDTFTQDIRDKTNMKRRIRPIIEFAVNNNLI